MPNAVKHRHLRLKITGIALAIPAVISLFACTLHEWLFHFDPFPASFLLGPAYLAALFLPFLVVLDRTETAPIGNRFWLGFTTVAMFSTAALWWILIAIGTFCRGPFGEFYWPWEPRVEKLEVLANRNLSEQFWLNWLQRPMPAEPWLREAPGLFLVAIWLVAIPAFATLLLRRRSPQMPAWRVLAILLIVQVAALLPLKMALRWTIKLKYLVAFPEWFLNL